MPRAIITESGEVKLPASIKKKYGLRPGMRLLASIRKNEIVLERDPLEVIDSLCGCLKSDSYGLKEFLQERARDREKEDAKLQVRRLR